MSNGFPNSEIFAGLSPETDFFCLVLLHEPDERQRARMQQLIDDGLDWERLRLLAENSRVSALLFYQLNALKLHGVPAAALAQFNRSFLTLALRGVALLQEFVELLKLFSAAGIPAIPYKGPQLGQTIYRHNALREAWDLDFIVKREHVLAAKQLLLDRGYQPEHPIAADEEEKYLNRDCEYNFDKGEMHVEIHWRIIPRSTGIHLDPQLIWAHCREEIFAGAPVTALRPELLLLILIIHGGDKHNWGRYKWLADLDRLLRTEQNFDWQLFAQLVKQVNARRCCKLGLYLAQKYFETPVNEEFRILNSNSSIVASPAANAQQAGKSAPPPNAAQTWFTARATVVHSRLFRPNHGLPGYHEFTAYFARFAAPQSSPSRLRLRLLYIKTILTPEFLDRIELPLPRPLAFLHYLYRPIRLALEHHGRIVSRLK